MKKIIIIGLVVLTLFVIPFLAACKTTPEPTTPTQPTTPAEPKTLTIGMVTSITGPMSAAFKGMYDAIQPAVDLYNNKGGITIGDQKYLLEIMAEDDQSSPQGGVAAINKIVQAGVKFTINPIFPPAHLAIIPIANEAKVLNFHSQAVNPSVFTSANPYTFNCYFACADVLPCYDYIQKEYPNTKKVALICPDDPAANFAMDLLEKELPNRGIELVAVERFGMDTQDFYPIVTKVLERKPDVIDLVVSIPPWVGSITNAARDMNYTGPIIGSGSFGDINIIKMFVNPEYQYGLIHTGIDPLSDKLPEITKEFRNTVEHATGQPFNFDNYQVICALSPIIQGITEAQSLDPDKVKITLENMEIDSPNGGSGTFKGQQFQDYQHMLITDQLPLCQIVEAGTIEFEYLPK